MNEPCFLPLGGRNGVIAYTRIDPDRYDELSRWRWGLNSFGYACRAQYKPEREMIYLARFLLGLSKGDGLIADHISRDTLDNRLCNLRVVTRAMNSQNRNKKTGTSSRHRGVCYARTRDRSKKWNAAAMVDGRRYHLGWFLTEEEAAEAAKTFRIENMPGAVD